MKKLIVSLLCLLLFYPRGLIVTAKPAIETANDFVRKPYLELLELNEIQRFSAVEIESVEAQLKKERDTEQTRLKKEEERIEKELKAARKRLDELNKKAS